MGYGQWAEFHAGRGALVRAVVLVLVEDLEDGGCFLRAYDRDGRETLETWHGGPAAAREWAASEY